MNTLLKRYGYGLATAVFVLGALDFAAYHLQQHGGFSEGLSDEFALKGLAFWLALAISIAGVTWKQSQKVWSAPTADPAGAAGGTVQQPEQIRPFIRIVAGVLGALSFISPVVWAVLALGEIGGRGVVSALTAGSIFLYAAVKGKMPPWLAGSRSKKSEPAPKDLTGKRADRPKLVWVIAGYNCIFMTLALLGSVLNPTNVDSLEIIVVALLTIGASLALFFLKAVAVKLFLASLLVDVPYSVWSFYSDPDFLSSLDKFVTIWTILDLGFRAYVVYYAHGLKQREVLT